MCSSLNAASCVRLTPMSMVVLVCDDHTLTNVNWQWMMFLFPCVKVVPSKITRVTGRKGRSSGKRNLKFLRGFVVYTVPSTGGKHDYPSLMSDTPQLHLWLRWPLGHCKIRATWWPTG